VRDVPEVLKERDDVLSLTKLGGTKEGGREGKEGGGVGKPMPWADWDTKAPVEYAVVHFEAGEVEGMYALATSLAEDASAGREGRGFMSHHDVLLAHIWAGIVLARWRAYAGG